MDLKSYFNQLWTKLNGKPTQTIHYQYDLDSIDYGKLWPSIYPYTVTTTTKVTHNYKSVVRDPARRWRKR
jgi:hypothetical protein